MNYTPPAFRPFEKPIEIAQFIAAAENDSLDYVVARDWIRRFTRNSLTPAGVGRALLAVAELEPVKAYCQRQTARRGIALGAEAEKRIVTQIMVEAGALLAGKANQ